jgi:hypothetical protein
VGVGLVVGAFVIFKAITFFGVVLGLWKKIHTSKKRIAELETQHSELTKQLEEERRIRRVLELRLNERSQQDFSVHQLKMLRDIHASSTVPSLKKIPFPGTRQK